MYYCLVICHINQQYCHHSCVHVGVCLYVFVWEGKTDNQGIALWFSPMISLISKNETRYSHLFLHNAAIKDLIPKTPCSFHLLFHPGSVAIQPFSLCFSLQILVVLLILYLGSLGIIFTPVNSFPKWGIANTSASSIPYWPEIAFRKKNHTMQALLPHI